MAIQIPNPGTGNGASGDNEFVLWSKVKDNFSDQTNAASRLVGAENGNVPVYSAASGLSSLGYGGKCAQLPNATNLFSKTWVTGFYNGNNLVNTPFNIAGWFFVEAIAGTQTNRVMLKLTQYLSGDMYVTTGVNGDEASWSVWQRITIFNDQTNAASRKVGTDTGNVMQVGAFGLGLPATNTISLTTSSDVHTLNNGFYANTAVDGAPLNTPDVSGRFAILKAGGIHSGFVLATKSGQDGVLHLKTQGLNNTWGTWSVLYSTKNTTVEDGTNYLKVASPILRLQHDAFVKEHEAEKMEIVVENPSTGIYKITGTTGLRNDGTWYFSPPKDEHNNVLCMVEVSEENDVITVNTYKKKFDFETVSIVPDYEQPTDIPKGATVMLRFNELPEV